MARKLSKKPVKVKKVIKKPKKILSPKKSVVEKPTAIKLPEGKYTQAIGRRKVATARVRIYHKPGDFIVNGMAAGQYFESIRHSSSYYMVPFKLTGTEGKFAVSVKVDGSGINAQLGAVIHGLSKALVTYNVDFKPALRQAGLITRDSRMKETRKPGRGGKARRKRQSPRR